MPSSPTPPARPVSAPDGAESLPGVIELYAAYDATSAAAKKNDATPQDAANFDSASQALYESRKFWREIKQYVQAAAFAVWEASQEGN